MQVTVIDTDDNRYQIDYERWEYPNLMELITNTYYSEIGACRGRALCGTCIVKVIDGKTPKEAQSKQEKYTLIVNNSDEKEHRLSCQIVLDEQMHEAVFRVIDPTS